MLWAYCPCGLPIIDIRTHQCRAPKEPVMWVCPNCEYPTDDRWAHVCMEKETPMPEQKKTAYEIDVEPGQYGVYRDDYAAKHTYERYRECCKATNQHVPGLTFNELPEEQKTMWRDIARTAATVSPAPLVVAGTIKVNVSPRCSPIQFHIEDDMNNEGIDRVANRMKEMILGMRNWDGDQDKISEMQKARDHRE